ncbi:MAG TPA: redoxin domain-containing protein [Pirellulales bacterium]|jgi:peroxiredoxin|nr:redoxin domain-containing protein [Pirellulales bacterium]
MTKLMMWGPLLLGGILLATAQFDAAFAAQPKPLEIGQPAPDFKLPGVDGQTHKLADYAAAKVLAVVFTCNHCPAAQAYEDRIIQLDKDFKSRGVALVAINPNDPHSLRLDELGYTDLSDSLAEMKIRAKEKNFTFPYLYDGDTQEVAAAYGVLATPHVFVFDADRKLRYQGRVDNSDVHQVTSQDARNAIEAVLAGKPVAVETTRVFGCSTKWADKQQTAVSSIKKWDEEPVTLETIDLDGIKKLAKNNSSPAEKPDSTMKQAKAVEDKATDAANTAPGKATEEKDAHPGKLLLVNLWASSCGDCVAEMPDLVTMNRMYRKRPFEFITISLDEPADKDQAQKALQEAHASGKNYLFTGEDKDKLAVALDPQWQGPTPYTMLIAPGGKVIYRHDGAIDALELKRAIVDYLGRTYAGRASK